MTKGKLERENEEREGTCVCVWERERGVRERESVCASIRDRDREREERERESVCVRERNIQTTKDSKKKNNNKQKRKFLKKEIAPIIILSCHLIKKASFDCGQVVFLCTLVWLCGELRVTCSTWFYSWVFQPDMAIWGDHVRIRPVTYDAIQHSI